MKQSAVEFLHSEYKRIIGDTLVDIQKVFAISDSFEKAKEMENQQQGYSEEEVLEIIKKLHTEIGFQFSNEIKEWCLKQFKNK